MKKNLILAWAAAAALGTADAARADFTLNLLHNNDGESQVLPTRRTVSGLGTVEPIGGASHFTGVVARQRSAWGGRSLLVSSGDNVLAGPAFSASLASGIFYDARVINRVGYDALTLGNHDFDFGPDVLADFIGQVDSGITFLSANLDFTNEPRLQALVNSGRIAASKVVNVDGTPVGIVGATTTDLRLISSPRNVQINPVVPAVQAEIDRLRADGVRQIILSSHLQTLQNELVNVVPNLRGLSLVIAGGGDELLVNPGIPTSDQVLPGTPASAVQGQYPTFATGLDGRNVPVVTTSGEYEYLGQARATFSTDGAFTGFSGPDTRPFRVLGDTRFSDAVAPDEVIEATVVDPVRQAVAGLAANVVATTQVRLDGTRNAVRTRETPFGNVIADALLDAGQRLAPGFGTNVPTVSLQNGGGIRNDVVINAGGQVTELDTFTALAFPNFVSVVQDVPVATFKALLERAVSAIRLDAAGNVIEAGAQGQFAQVGGFKFTYDARRIAQTVDNQTGVVTRDGQRVLDVLLDGVGGTDTLTLPDGTTISGLLVISDGQVVGGFEDFVLNVATIDFLARGGDGYPFFDPTTGDRLGFTTLGLTYQQALAFYLSDTLGGVVSAGQYPEGGLGRINLIPEPGVMALPLLMMLGLRRRRSA